MSVEPLIREALAATPSDPGRRTRTTAGVLVALGLAGLGVGFFAGDGAAGWVALLVATALTVGLGVFGVVLSAIFELTGARWGRAYRRLAEGSVVLMPLGLAGAIVLVAGGGAYLPWVGEHLEGGKAIWLTQPFWSVRVLGALLVADAVALWFLYYSLRRDFCLAEVRQRFSGRIASWVARGIEDPEAEARRCSARLSTLAPVVGIVYALTFTLLGFDLVMALEPGWFSTLFGAWFFIGHLFAGLALLAVVSLVLGASLPLASWLTDKGQRDLATLLFAFTLINADFFWSQYLTIWYGNLPEETGYVIHRTVDASLPWASLSWVTLAAFFAIPFVALLFRRVKQARLLLGGVSLLVVAGIFLARFLEIAPPLLQVEAGWQLGEAARPLVAAALVTLGFGGVGWWLYRALLTAVPIMPVGDEVFQRAFSSSRHKEEG